MCGIFGIINNKPSKFNKTAFNILGINNDSRGGDSCGIFIDGEVEYGVNKEKLYADFFKTSELLNKTKKCKIALGHCRKASVGAININTAQPVVLRNDKGEVEFVVIHNGTIYNYKELAEKYIPNIDITGLTDSQVMARIFYHCGYDVLEEYYGGAVFVIVDYREETPKIFMWKGSSRQTSANTLSVDERPLYFIETKEGIIFSSISTYLHAFSEGVVYSINANTLLSVEADDIYVEKEYNRSKVTQSQYYPKIVPCSTYYGFNDFEEFDLFKPINNVENKTKCDQNAKVRVTYEGLYERNGTLLHGCYCIDLNGTVYEKEDLSKNIVKLWFWEGVLLYSNKEFTFLVNTCKHFCLSPSDIKWTSVELLNYFSPYPVSHADYIPTNYKGLHCKALKDNTMEPFTGSVIHFLDGKRTIYAQGFVRGTVWNCTKEDGLIELREKISKIKIDYKKLYKELYRC